MDCERQNNLNVVVADKRYLKSIYTGLVTGGQLTINAGDASKFDIAAGSGIIVDHTTDPSKPTLKAVAWDAKTAVAVTNIGTLV